MVLNIINGNFGLVKSWQKSLRPIGASVLFVPFWSHSKPHTKAQLKRPKRPVQLDNQLYGEKHIDFLEHTWKGVCECWTFIHSLLNKLIETELEWRLKLFSRTSNLWFWISPHQGTLSCSYILKLTQHMLSIANEVDLLIFRCVHAY